MILEQAEKDIELTLDEYYKPEIEEKSNTWADIKNENKRQVELINQFFTQKLENDKKAVFIGEDVLSPYGGAFKVAKNLSFKFPDRVFSTPISEAALVGISNGLALSGFKPYAEIMFGDFMTLAMDQIINHASKFHHMYNGKASCPIVIRTPMGGKRGYGPTHSQTLDKFLVGLDNVTTIALNTLINPGEIYETIHQEPHPVIVIENKVDYGKKVGNLKIKNYRIQRNFEKYPVIKASPVISEPTATIVTYGTNADWVIENLNVLFSVTDFIPEVIVLTKIHPINYNEILNSVNKTRRLYVVEEGSKLNGIGSEIIAGVMEQSQTSFYAKRIGAVTVPIPAVKSLENMVLPGIEMLINAIKTR